MSARRILVVILTLGILATPVPTEAQQSAKVPRIGWLSIASRTPAVSHLIEAFWQGLRELGYVEGQNIAIEYRFAEGRPERLPEFAAQLVALKVDIIVTPNPAGTQAAREATRTIPIVILGVADPVGSGLVASLSRPGGNITGLTSPVMWGKRLELLKETVPKASRVAVLRNPTNPETADMSRDVGGAARALGVQLQVLDVRVPIELDSAFARMTRDRAGALLVTGDTLFTLHREQIAVLAIKRRLPAISWAREFAEAGLLMAYGRSLPYEFRRAATYVDKILKGAKPADLPVEQPTKFELVINLKTAKALGLTIPQSVLIRADQVIQ
ncbi:MAG TPA: ABC transporter substrate-binding protein [Candidatus Methylomirabilis sp.]|jgi:putative ABC transport system substrate-binding protein